MQVEQLAELGWWLLPIAAGEKNPGILLGQGWHLKASSDLDTIYAWQDQCIRLTEARQADHWWAFDDTSDVASTVRAALAHWGCR